MMKSIRFLHFYYENERAHGKAIYDVARSFLFFEYNNDALTIKSLGQRGLITVTKAI